MRADGWRECVRVEKAGVRMLWEDGGRQHVVDHTEETGIFCIIPLVCLPPSFFPAFGRFRWTSVSTKINLLTSVAVSFSRFFLSRITLVISKTVETYQSTPKTHGNNNAVVTDIFVKYLWIPAVSDWLRNVWNYAMLG